MDLEQNSLIYDDSHRDFFQPLRTISVTLFLLSCDVAVLITAFVLPVYYDPSDKLPSLYSVFLYLQCFLWTIAVVADQIITHKHQASQLSGYVDFNKKMLPYSRAPLMTITCCSMLLLLIAGITWDFCPRVGSCSSAAPLSPAHYVQIILSLQTCILLPLILAYAVWVHQFNYKRQLPDVFEGQMVSSLSRNVNSFRDVGVRDASASDDLFEKQAEAIYFLKQHNARLSQKILALTAQLANTNRV